MLVRVLARVPARAQAKCRLIPAKSGQAKKPAIFVDDLSRGCSPPRPPATHQNCSDGPPRTTILPTTLAHLTSTLPNLAGNPSHQQPDGKTYRPMPLATGLPGCILAASRLLQSCCMPACLLACLPARLPSAMTMAIVMMMINWQTRARSIQS